MSLLGFCQWLEETSLSVAIRESSWGFPIIESIHVLGLCLFGMAVLVDLRVVGVALKRVPLSEMASELTPWVTAGVAVMIVSGLLTFLNTPVEYYNDTFFRVKVLLLLLVGVNALIVRTGVWRKATVARTLSLVLWAGIIVAGRMIAYHLLGAQ
jgi:uncharacterized protein DUF6644